MTALTRFLYPAPARRSVGGIIRWWEKRRLAYNVVVGASGLVSVATFAVLHALPPLGSSVPGLPWQPVVAFGVLANVFYLLGPATEVAVHKLWGGQVLPVGPALFRMGLTFSVGLAFLPVMVATVAWVIRVVAAVFGLA